MEIGPVPGVKDPGGVSLSSPWPWINREELGRVTCKSVRRFYCEFYGTSIAIQLFGTTYIIPGGIIIFRIYGQKNLNCTRFLTRSLERYLFIRFLLRNDTLTWRGRIELLDICMLSICSLSSCHKLPVNRFRLADADDP